MEADSLEVECPLCDHKVPAEARRCPSCGVDFAVSGMDELEAVAKEISDGKPPAPRPAVERILSPPGNGETNNTSIINAEPVPNQEYGENGSKKGKKGLKGIFSLKK